MVKSKFSLSSQSLTDLKVVHSDLVAVVKRAIEITGEEDQAQMNFRDAYGEFMGDERQKAMQDILAGEATEVQIGMFIQETFREGMWYGRFTEV